MNIDAIIRRALDEDLPDITSESIFDPAERGRAAFVVKERGIIAGLALAEATFKVIALLSGEQTALHLLQRASGIATLTRRYVDAVKGTRATIVDTRKTAPGLRALDKYAVRCGGAENHRIGLFDMFLVKNNHIDRAGSINAALEHIRRRGLPQKIMVEVRDMAELDEALALRPDFILLDNMTPAAMRQAVERVGGKV